MHHPSIAPALRRTASAMLATTLALATVSCAGPKTTTGTGTTEPTSGSESLVLASTTSTQDSGLFDVLIPAFEKAFPRYKVKVIAVGTGEALKLGEQKDADVLLVHAKADEVRFVADGFGTERRDVMYNDFLIVGPPSDPAKVKGSEDVTAAVRAIEAAGKAGKTIFVSRGDDSGTHKKELKLWKAAGLSPAGGWYKDTGQGMGDTLKVASEKRGYTLTDRATYLSMKDALELALLMDGKKDLFNQYGVIPVAGAKNQAGAKAFADWITGAEGQTAIGAFGLEEYGQQLFVPNAGK